MILPSLSTSSSWRCRARRQYTRSECCRPAGFPLWLCRLQHVFRSTVVARLMYAASSWRGLTKASDRQRINSVIDRARRHGYCSPDLPTFDDLCDAADDELFAKAARLSNHVLHSLLPPPSTASQRYDLRQRIHSLQLPEHSTHLSD